MPDSWRIASLRQMHFFGFGLFSAFSSVRAEAFSVFPVGFLLSSVGVESVGVESVL